MAKKKETAFDFRTAYLALSEQEQQGITNFFNTHNVAHWIYYSLSEEAQRYISACIKANNDAQKIEKENSAQDS